MLGQPTQGCVSWLQGAPSDYYYVQGTSGVARDGVLLSLEVL